MSLKFESNLIFSDEMLLMNPDQRRDCTNEQARSSQEKGRGIHQLGNQLSGKEKDKVERSIQTPEEKFNPLEP